MISALALIVIPGLKKLHPVRVDEINQAMLFRDSPGPGASQWPFQRFWLANPAERLSNHGLDEFQNPHSDLPVEFNPVAQVISELGMEDGGCFAMRR